MTPEEINELPRLEPRYGGTYLLLNSERFLIRRGVPDFQLGDEMRAHVTQDEAVMVFKDSHVDCPRCRTQRHALAKAHPNLVRKTLVERLRARRDGETYWCNDCQATGWVLEPLVDAIVRYDIMTWERVVAKLTDAQLKEALASASDMNFRLYKKGYPPAVLAAEAAKRL